MIAIKRLMSLTHGSSIHAPTLRQQTLITFFPRAIRYPIVYCLRTIPNPFQMDLRHFELRWEIFKVKVTIDYVPCRDKKRNRSISYVVGGRRPTGNNRSVLVYDSINVYVPINDLLAFGEVEIVMLSVSRQLYYESINGSFCENAAVNMLDDF